MTKEMNLNIKKISPPPKDQWEAIELMNKAHQDLIDALHIMDSVIENNTNDFKEINERRIKEFIKKFE